MPVLKNFDFKLRAALSFFLFDYRTCNVATFTRYKEGNLYSPLVAGENAHGEAKLTKISKLAGKVGWPVAV